VSHWRKRTSNNGGCLVAAIMLALCGCSVTHRTATTQTRIACLSDHTSGPYGESETVSGEGVKIAGLGAAAYMHSAIAAVAIAIPETAKTAVEIFRTSADNVTTSTSPIMEAPK
jgi:hypothetical protein